VVGYNQTEGIYVKNTFNYYINQRAYGNVYVDFFSKLGIGLGVRQALYDLGKVGNGPLYVYHLPHKDSQLWRGRFEHETQEGIGNLRRTIHMKTQWTADLSIPKPSSPGRQIIFLGKPVLFTRKIPRKSEALIRIRGSLETDLADGWQLHLDGKVTERGYDHSLKNDRLPWLKQVTLGTSILFTLGFQQKYNPDHWLIVHHNRGKC